MDHRDSGESRDQAISKVSYTHDAMIDMIIQNPQISQSELAVMFGYTAPWISRIMASDAFQERLAQRRHEMVDPGIAQTLDEGFREVAQKSLQVLKTHLENPIHPDSTVKIADRKSVV